LEKRSVLKSATSISLLSGLFMLLFLQLFAEPMARGYSGEAGATVVKHALTYIRIRGIGVPAGLVMMTAQAACLGNRDSVNPLVAVALSSLINLFGVLLLVTVLGTGIAGAAWATTVSQLLGLWMLLRVVARMAMATSVSVDSSSASSPPMNSVSAAIRSLLPGAGLIIAVPTLKELRKFFGFAGPIFFALLGKIACYSMMTHVATTRGALALAAHQVMLGIFFCFCPFVDCMSQTAQSFLPSLFRRRASTNPLESRAAAAAASSLMCRLFMLNGLIGSLCGLGVFLLPTYLPQIFTSSPAVAALLREAAPFGALAMVGHGMVCASEGMLLADRRVHFLAGAYGVSTFLMPAILHWVKQNPSLRGVRPIWAVFVGFQVIRSSSFIIKLLVDNTAWRRTQRAKETMHLTTQHAHAVLGVAGSGGEVVPAGSA
jgi:Na+-driven multidrug efflux pump